MKGLHGNNWKDAGPFAKIGATIVKLCGFGKRNYNGKTGVVAGPGARLAAGKEKGGIGSDADARTEADKRKVAGVGTGAVVIGSGKRSGKSKGEYAEDRAQPAEKSENRRNALETELEKAEELAASQRSALEAKLKSAEDRAQLAEKSGSRRNALETELKKAEELAARQRSALEAEVKSAEDRAQLAEKNADVATSQRIRLEAELKKAQEKAQLAQKISDIVSQSQAKENGLPNGEPSQKSADLSANKSKSGQTEPLNAGLTSKPEPSTQPADSSVQSTQTSGSLR